MYSSNTINLACRNYISTSDNSANEIITHHLLDDKKDLKLKITMKMFGSKEPMTPKDIVREIWKHHISHTVK